MPKIMIVDDDAAIQMELEEYLAHMDYTVVGTADTGEGAIEMARETAPDLILMDINLPGEMDGISAAQEIKEEMDVAVVFITGFGDPEYIERAKRVEPFGYVMKPFDEREINGVVEIALYKKEMELKLRIANDQLNHANRDLKQEIQERKQTEENLEREFHMRTTLLDNIPDCIALIVKKDTHEIVASNRFARDLGAVPGQTCFKTCAMRDDNCPFCLAPELWATGQLQTLEVEYRGEWYKGIWTPLSEDLYVHYIFVITEQKRAEEALRESEEKFRTLVDNLPVGVYRNLPGPEGKFLMANPAFCKMFGFKNEEELKKVAPAELYVNPKDREQYSDNLIEKRVVENDEQRMVKRDGTPVHASITSRVVYGKDGEVSHFDSIMLDITEKQRLESQLHQAQKMEAIGTLTGGLAHDYNNLLAVIMGNLSMAQEEAEPHSAMAELLHEIEQASYKARDLTHQFLTLSQGGHPRKELGSMESLLKEILGQVQAHEVSTTFSIQDDLWPVEYDSKQMHYTISNVLSNAVEAMPHGGTITLQAENQVIENQPKDSVLPLNEGKYVRISIKDEGRGIPEKHLSRIFDPYFSTKERGDQKGMGLGLATAYAIVEKHGGHIMVNSTTGVGTTVSIYLPATAAESKAPGAKRDEMKAQSSINKQQSTIRKILVMDDEEMLRNLAQKMLERLGGYKVETVKDGVEAIETYKKHMDLGEPFDGVILDLTIKGGMGGAQAIKELIKIDPDVKAIVCSGYSNDPVLANYEEHGFRGAMAKPYQMADLESVLKQVLG